MSNDDNKEVSLEETISTSSDELVLDQPSDGLGEFFDSVQPVGLDDIEIKEEPEEEEETKVPETPKRRPSNMKLEDPYETNPARENEDSLPFPSVTLEEFEGFIKHMDEVHQEDDEEDDEDLMDWYNTVGGGSELYVPQNLFTDRFTDEDSEFVQGVPNNEGNSRVGIGSVNFNTKPGELTGEVALLKVSRRLGLGDVVSIPLPHTGIWVTMKPPTDIELINFQNSMYRRKEMLGRKTYGLTLTNFSTIINDDLLEFIIEHIHSTNNKDITPKNISQYLSLHDYHILVWGLACSIYPKGYNYSRACINDPKKCGHREEAILNLNKLLWVDNKSLTEVQRTILYDNRSTKLSLQHYEKYQVEHKRSNKTVVTNPNGFKFNLRIPTFKEYITDGMRWINMINEAIEDTMINTPREDDVSFESEDARLTRIKEEAFNKYVKASILRQYSHFVESIEVDDNIIKDKSTLDKVLNDISSDDELRTWLGTEILEFKSRTAIALIGIPSYHCKKCKVDQNPYPIKEEYKSVIPLDVLGTVFLLLATKISKILKREA